MQKYMEKVGEEGAEKCNEAKQKSTVCAKKQTGVKRGSG